MRYRFEWLQIALGVLILLPLTRTQEALCYEYDETLDPYEYDYAVEEVHTSAKWEEGTASASPDDGTGECSCAVHTYTRIYTPESASADAEAYGMGRTEWVWNGPPGTAPGGTLDWDHDGQGFAEVWGYRDSSEGSTDCAAYAASLTGATCPSTSMLSRFIGIAQGSVEDWNRASASTSHDVTPTDAWHYAQQYPPPDGGYGDGWFDLLIIWGVYDNGSPSIAAGTAQFLFDRVAYCSAFSTAEAEGDADTWSYTYTTALVRGHATFTPNP